MNRSYQTWMLLPALLLFGMALRAQPCDWRNLPGVQGHPAVLSLLTGDFSVDPAAELPMDDGQVYLEMLSAGTPLSLDSGGLRQSFFQAGLAELADGRATGARRLFEAAADSLDEDRDCSLRFFRLIARYLELYGGTAPIYPHFNGGFHNFLKDSLYWAPTDTAQYDQALTAVMELVQWNRSASPVYLELLGDLLSGHRDGFVANYFAWLAYMRAATLMNNGQKAAFERKAIFALEAPLTNEDRFNRYRSTQLGKALQEDLVSVRLRKESLPAAPPVRFFPEGSGGRLSAMMQKVWKQELARDQRDLKYDEKVDMNTVKRDTRFNSYALFLIAVIIGAVVFFWIKLRRANRTR